MDFSACFNQVKKTLPPELVNEFYTGRINEIAPLIKSFTLASLECRLSSADHEVDLALGFESHSPLKWMEAFSSKKLKEHPTAKADYIRLKQLVRFFTNTPGQQSFLRDSIQGFWINFDLHSTAGIPIPWTYLVYRDLKLGNEFYGTLLSATIHALDSGYEEATMERMQQCVLNLPDQAWLLGLAIPAWRSINTYRMVLYGMNFEQISGYLSRIRWGGNSRQFRKQLGQAGRHCEALGLLLDFSNGLIHPKIGLELLIHPDRPETQVSQLLKSLSELGVCDAGKANALTRWMKLKDQKKEHLEIKSYDPGSGLKLKVQQWINHFKIVYDPGSSVSAKCYFGLRPVL